MNTSRSNPAIVLAHGAWADGSSWNAVIGPLQSKGLRMIAAPLPLTSLTDDVAALDRAIERTEGPVILAAHAYAGAIISASTSERVQSLVFIAALAPDEGETVADVFYRVPAHPDTAKLAPDANGLIWMAIEDFGKAFANARRGTDAGCHPAPNRGFLHSTTNAETRLENQTVMVPHCRRGPDDQSRDAALHGDPDESTDNFAKGRPHAAHHLSG
jgi:hypothetical protein